MIEPYQPSQFTKKDYHILYNMASSKGTLKFRIRDAMYRDKRIQRNLIYYEELTFYCEFKQLPKHINTPSISAKDILRWRLQLNK